MRNKISVDVQRMFEHACSFADCAQSCEVRPWFEEDDYSKLRIPYVVNSAFAIEIFIKSLLVYHGKTFSELREHSLLKLWEELVKVDLCVADEIQNNIMFAFDSKDDPFFCEALSNIAIAFERWRYIYEYPNESIFINFIKIFREVLREICCEVFYKTTWKAHIKSADNED